MNRMIIYFNVLGVLMKDCISSNLNGTSVISMKRRRRNYVKEYLVHSTDFEAKQSQSMQMT